MCLQVIISENKYIIKGYMCVNSI